MGAIFAVVNSALKETGDARNKDIAVGLAQEGLEKARQARDGGSASSAAGGSSATLHNIEFTRQVTVEWDDRIQFEGSSGPERIGAWRVMATVSWRADNRNTIYTAKTILGKR